MARLRSAGLQGSLVFFAVESAQRFCHPRTVQPLGLVTFADFISVSTDVFVGSPHRLLRDRIPK